MNPDLSISNIPGVGKYYSYKLKKLDIDTAEDLIYHFPFRYDDFSQIKAIENIQTGDIVSVQGIIWQIKNVRTRTGKFVTVATVADQSGTIHLDGFRPKLISPSYEIIRPHTVQSTLSTLHTGRLVPVYPETEGISSKWLRGK